MHILTLALVVSISVFAWADEADDLRKDLNKHTSDLETVEKAIEAQVKALDMLSGQLKEQGCDSVDENGKINGCTIAEENLRGANALPIQRNRTARAIRTIRDNIARSEARRNELKEKAVSLTAKLEAQVSERKPAESVAVLLDLVQIQDAEGKALDAWTRVKSGEMEMNEALDDIEDQLDRSAVGLYFQDKMGQFVNSSLMCHAVKRCTTTSERKEVDNKYLKELFPYMNDKNSRTKEKYYDKTKKRRGNQ